MSEGEVHPAVPQPTDQTTPTIPWEHRRRIGRITAYWRTVLYVLTNRRKLHEDMATPLDLSSAREFRLWTGCHVLGALVLATCVCLVHLFADGSLEFGNLETMLMRLGIGILVTAISFFAITGAVAWLFASRDFDDEQQDRAIAIAYYTSGPLAFTALSPLLLGIGLLAVPLKDAGWLLWGIGIFSLLIAGCWYVLVVSAVHSVMGRRIRRTALAAVALAAIWIGIPILIMSVLPAAAMWALMIASLT